MNTAGNKWNSSLRERKEVKDTNYNICIICQLDEGRRDYYNYTDNPTETAIKNILNVAGKGTFNGDLKYKTLLYKMQNLSSEQLKLVPYHRTCYQNLTHKQSIQQLIDKIEISPRKSGHTK